MNTRINKVNNAERLDSHRSEDENENKCLQYIEGSFRLLEQARAAVLTSSIQPTNSQPTTSSGVRSKRAENAAKDFRQSFPGLSSRTSGKNMQTFLPATSSGKSRALPYSRGHGWSGKVLNTWTHDFVALGDIKQDITPTVHQLGWVGEAKSCFQEQAWIS